MLAEMMALPSAHPEEGGVWGVDRGMSEEGAQAAVHISPVCSTSALHKTEHVYGTVSALVERVRGPIPLGHPTSIIAEAHGKPVSRRGQT